MSRKTVSIALSAQDDSIRVGCQPWQSYPFDRSITRAVIDCHSPTRIRCVADRFDGRRRGCRREGSTSRSTGSFASIEILDLWNRNTCTNVYHPFTDTKLCHHTSPWIRMKDWRRGIKEDVGVQFSKSFNHFNEASMWYTDANRAS